IHRLGLRVVRTMRLTGIEATSVQPIQAFSATGLRDIVVLAGPNGVGKTRFIEALLNKFQRPNKYPKIRLLVEATSPGEQSDWKKRILDTAIPDDARLLATTLQKNRFRREWT